MNYKFIQPVSMRVTKEQYERDLREPLLKMGYERFILDWALKPILVTNIDGRNGLLSNVIDDRKSVNNRYFIPDYNPEFFLAIAAMTDKESPIVGEWLVWNSVYASVGGYKIGDIVQCGSPNITLVGLRKATLQELIEKFTNKETIKESAMKIEVIKPKEEKWNFPCKGICEVNGLIIGFTKEGTGCVLDKGKTNCDLYTSQMYLDMDKFTPIKEKGNNYDWFNPKFPILVKGIGDDIFTIDGFDEVDNSVSITTFSFSGKVHYWCEEREKFSSEEERNEWLKSLEILPKGTEIKITF